jgi:hypothetical protein
MPLLYGIDDNYSKGFPARETGPRSHGTHSHFPTLNPPSISRAVPVTNAASSLAR